MQQHPKGKHRSNSGQRNANRRNDPSVIRYVESLPERLIGGDFASEYLRQQFRSKYTGDDGVSTARERRQAAIEKWLIQETINRETNLRLRSTDRGFNILPRVSWYRFLQLAQRFVAEVLGPLSDEVCLGSFSGGASTSRRRTSSHPAMKFVGVADASWDACRYVDNIHHVAPMLRQYRAFFDLRIVEGAVLFTVPKNANIDRCACKEPDLNMFLQKGVGSHIRRRLRRFGIDLNDQSRNRTLAHRGSVDGTLCTIDLSSASDSITTATVLALLPYDWYLYLNDIRSQSVWVDGELHETAMFSSMGNGFTFELESLIFWALCKSVAYLRGYPGIISVYGDDIIAPSEAYDDIQFVFEHFGFRVNPDKSFSTGPFRESCGGHYHLGTDVTPFYLRDRPERISDLIRIANQLRHWAMSDWGREYSTNAWALWSELKKNIPSKLWGGCDLESDTQLASPDIPHSTLRRVSKSRAIADEGSYLHWHNSNWNRSRDPDNVGFSSRDTLSWCVYRRAKPGALAIESYFPEEVDL